MGEHPPKTLVGWLVDTATSLPTHIRLSPPKIDNFWIQVVTMRSQILDTTMHVTEWMTLELTVPALYVHN